MSKWISVNAALPESRTLCWIFVTYEPSPYDNVTERISIGVYVNDSNYWTDILDFPFADDYTVKFWQKLDFPEVPK